MIWSIFCFWLLILPLISWNGRFEGPKVILFLVASFFMAIYLLIKKRKELINSFKFGDLLYFIWILILNFSSLYGVHPLDSILGGSYRHQGVVFFVGLWIVAKAIFLTNEKYKDLLKLGFIPIILFESLLMIFQGVFFKGRPLGTLGEPNASAGFLAISFPFLILALEKINEKKILGWLILILPFIAILFSGSQTAIFALIPVIIYLFLTKSGFEKKSWQKIIYILIVLMIGIISFFVIRSGFLTRKNSEFENRSLIWKLGIYKIIKNPLLGYGAESGEHIYDEAYRQAEKPLVNLIVDRARNLFLDVTLWSGLIGLVFFSGWFISGGIVLSKNKRWLNIVGLSSFLIFSFFSPLGVVHWLILVLILNLK